MAQDALLLAYCCAVGFVSAGVTASFHKLVTSKPARFALLGESWLAAFSSFMFFAVSGPSIVTSAAFSEPLFGANRLGWMAGSLAVALLWSACSGIFVLQLVLSLRDGLI